jgi:hypothetical protein
MARAWWGLVIEISDEVVEAGLLLQAVDARRSCGFHLQGEMHALVASVLCGLSGLDALNRDA